MSDLDLDAIINRSNRQLRYAPLGSDQFRVFARDVPAMAQEIDALRERVAEVEADLVELAQDLTGATHDEAVMVFEDTYGRRPMLDVPHDSGGAA